MKIDKNIYSFFLVITFVFFLVKALCKFGYRKLPIKISCLELVFITVHVIFILDIIFFKNQCLLMWSQTGCSQIRTVKMSRSGSKLFDTENVFLKEFVVKSDNGKIYRKITQ